jgi:hypothetical protein
MTSYAVLAIGTATVVARFAAGRTHLLCNVAALSSFGLKVGITFLIAGLVLVYLAHSKKPLLPNEIRDENATSAPGGRGWLSLMALCLIVLPFVAVVQLRPLLELWSATSEFATSWNLTPGSIGGDQDPLGLMLPAVMAATLVPLGEVLLAASVVLCSAALLPLFVFRSRLFPRILLMSVILQFSLLVGTRYAIDLDMVGNVRQAIDQSPPNTQDADAQPLLDWAERHQASVGPVARSLGWTLAGYAVWLPAVFVSNRVRTVFTNDPATATTFAFSALRSITQTAFEGKTYNSPEEMPADVRERYETILATLDAAEQVAGDGTLKALPHRVVKHALQRIVCNGRVYQSVDDLPPEVRKVFKETMPGHEG